eukprot:GHRQ01039046.1.p1 GENE.GHRQ01039046.1~~GHRQ01039046.1.p1  ORF type:complete len:312 (+),score=107.21 GHRQ01039046.1:2-937(+)
MHITKNYLADQGAISASTKVPLIMGIWGLKGCGKTFQTELAFKKLGVEPIVMSAGELESETAGQPGRLIRERYRKAAELSRTRGKLSCLVINDLDAGIGRFGNTQVTVNNQIVIGTLMNICDDPNRVSIGANWRESDTIKRVPIIVTGNDFSTLYAPLIRDGRMEKFYWQPQREDIVNIVWQVRRAGRVVGSTPGWFRLQCTAALPWAPRKGVWQAQLQSACLGPGAALPSCCWRWTVIVQAAATLGRGQRALGSFSSPAVIAQCLAAGCAVVTSSKHASAHCCYHLRSVAVDLCKHLPSGPAGTTALSAT